MERPIYDRVMMKWLKDHEKERKEYLEKEYKRFQELMKPAALDWCKYLINNIPFSDKCVVNISFEDKKEEEKMKLSDFIKKYGDCEVTEEMDKCIKKKGKWMPARGQKYYFATDCGLITHRSWDFDLTDIYRRAFIRIFKTGEETERYLEIMKVCKEASFEPDWEDVDQAKYIFSYDYLNKNLYVTFHNICNEGQQFFFESKEITQKLIDRFGEKDIAKYVLGVEVED